MMPTSVDARCEKVEIAIDLQPCGRHGHDEAAIGPSMPTSCYDVAVAGIGHDRRQGYYMLESDSTSVISPL